MSTVLNRKKSLEHKIGKVEDEKVEEYIELLSEKYRRIRNILQEEDKGLEEEYSRNEALKSKLVKK